MIIQDHPVLLEASKNETYGSHSLLVAKPRVVDAVSENVPKSLCGPA